MTSTRTAPHVKWLLNERAAAQGELDAVQQDLARLEERKRKLQETISSLDSVMTQVGLRLSRIELPVVKAHTRYAGRGNLTEVLRKLLRQAYPEALDTPTLLAAVEAAFGLEFSDAEQRDKYRHNCLRTPLRKLVSLGEVERIGNRSIGTNTPGHWRWVPPIPSFADVHAQVAANDAKDVDLAEKA